MTILGLVPARGGSKGVPGKNLTPLGGKPLLAWTIAAALESGAIDKIVVSSDHSEILATAAKFGAISLARPPELAGDDAGMMPVAAHALRELKMQGNSIETLVLLQPTSPLRSAQDIRAAVALHRTSGRPVVSVQRVKANPAWMFWMDNDGTLARYEKGEWMAHRRQDLPPLVTPNGALYVVAASSINVDASFFDDALGYLMSAEHSIDIDEPFDLEIVRLIVSARQNDSNLKDR